MGRVARAVVVVAAAVVVEDAVDVEAVVAVVVGIFATSIPRSHMGMCFFRVEILR